MTFLESIAAEVSTVFLDKETSFAEDLIIYPLGDLNDPRPVVGVWDEDAVPGSNETLGDGRVMNKPTGRVDRKSIIIELAADAPIQTRQPTTKFDKIRQVSTGLTANAKRIVGRDDGMISLLAVVPTIDSKRTGSRVG